MAEPRPAPAIALSVSDACKRFGDDAALDGMALELAAGEWLGLLGPNGAGKTTLILAIAGLLSLDSGRIELGGRLARGPSPESVGLVPQEIALYPQLTALENLRAFGRLHGLRRNELDERIRWALDFTGLAARAGDRVASYSGGMKRRLNIACGVLHRPRVVLLDEPTVGVDPQARERIFAMLDELRTAGAALLQSTHELGDVETRCDRLVVMDHGRAISDGPLDALIRDTVGERARLVLELDSPLPAGLFGDAYELDGTVVSGSVTRAGDELTELLGRIRDSGRRVERIDLRPPGLAEVFVALTGRDLRE